MRVTTTSDYGYTNGPVHGAGAKLPALSSASVRKRRDLKQASMERHLRVFYENLLRQPAPRHLVELIETLADSKGGGDPLASPAANPQNSELRELSERRVERL